MGQVVHTKGCSKVLNITGSKSGKKVWHTLTPCAFLFNLDDVSALWPSSWSSVGHESFGCHNKGEPGGAGQGKAVYPCVIQQATVPQIPSLYPPPSKARCLPIARAIDQGGHCGPISLSKCEEPIPHKRSDECNPLAEPSRTTQTQCLPRFTPLPPPNPNKTCHRFIQCICPAMLSPCLCMQGSCQKLTIPPIAQSNQKKYDHP